MTQADTSRSVTFQSDGNEDRSVLQIARKVAATIGVDFFRTMTRHLADALGADSVIVGEFIGGREERCRTVAAWLDGAQAEFEFVLAESAVAPVLLGKTVQWRSGAQAKFPQDTLLLSTGAQAYIGLPLSSASGPIGVLMALFRRRVSSLRFAKDLLEIFAERASAELAHKLDEDALRASEQRYRAFIADNTDGMWRIEFSAPVPTDLPEEEQLDRIYQTGYIAECNDATARLLGFEKSSQLIGCGIDEIAPASDPSVREATLVAIRTGYQSSVVETSPMHPDGQRRHMLRSQWGIVEDGKLERMWGSTRDITDMKLTETALDASEQRMADLLEAMRLVVVILDHEGAVAFCNQYLYRFTGWQPRDILGKNWLYTMVPEHEHSFVRSEFARAALNPETPIHFDCAIQQRDGQHRQLAWDSTFLRAADGTFSARALMGRDITEFKALEEQFRHAQKLAGIGRLAGGVAHDFNNLLTVILGYTGGLLDKVKPDDPSHVGLSEIKKAAEQGADLSRRLLTFSSRQTLHPQVLNLNALIQEMEHMLNTLLGSQTRLIMNLKPDLGLVHLDAGYFHQVLLNFAINARDAMPRGGTLTIATSDIEISDAQPHGTGIPAGLYVQLTVADNGTGMGKDVREHLFEPFFTTKGPGKGTGLGLSTVYGIIKQSGGHVLVDTEPGRGTAFRIYLPRAKEDAQSLPAAKAHLIPRGEETILLVEDRDDVRALSSEVLTNLGYTLLESPGPTGALELIREHTGTIHLLIANVGIPELPVNELVDLVKIYQPRIKVLFISGYGEAELPNRLSEPGFGYLQKPFTPLVLGVKVRDLLDHD